MYLKTKTSQFYLGNESKVIGRTSHLIVQIYHRISLLFEGRNSKITYRLDLIMILFPFLQLRSIYDVIRPPGWKSFVRRHREPSFSLLFRHPLTLISLPLLPHINIPLNSLILLPSITKIEIPRNNTHIKLCIHLLNLLDLVNSLLRIIQTFKMNTIDPNTYLLFLPISQLQNCS